MAGHGCADNDIKINISFRGSLFNSQACFIPQYDSDVDDLTADLLEFLNQNNELKEGISGIDLEKGAITYFSNMDCWKIQLVPFPGSFISMLIPPAKYLVKLKEEEVETLVTCINIIAETLSKFGRENKGCG